MEGFTQKANFLINIIFQNVQNIPIGILNYIEKEKGEEKIGKVRVKGIGHIRVILKVVYSGVCEAVENVRENIGIEEVQKADSRYRSVDKVLI